MSSTPFPTVPRCASPLMPVPLLQHQLVSQPGLNRGLILDLLDKMKNPGKGLPAEIDEEEPEVRALVEKGMGTFGPLSRVLLLPGEAAGSTH